MTTTFARPAPFRVTDMLVEASRATVHAMSWGIWVFSFAAWESVFAAAVGGFAGCVVGRALSKTRLRAVAVVALLLALFAAGFFGRTLLTGSLSELVDFAPAASLRLADMVFWCLTALAVSGVLRFASSRAPLFAVGELTLVGSAFAQALMAHRHGLINRPFALADFWIAANMDPSWIFVGLGAVAAALGLLLFLRERRLWRALLHLGVVAALLLVAVGTTRVVSKPTTDSGLGLSSGEEGSNDSKSSDNREPRSGTSGTSETGGRQRPANEEMEFRDKYTPSGNEAPMAVVLFHDDYSPPQGIYYFRQAAFSQYNGTKLVSATRGDVDQDLIPSFPTTTIDVPEPPLQNEHRAELETTVALMADHARPFAIEAPVTVQPTNNPDPSRFRRIYRATSSVQMSHGAELLNYDVGSEAWSEDQWRHYTRAPSDPRYKSLSDEIVERIPEDFRTDPVAKAYSVVDWLSRKGIYSLKNKHGGSDDPVGSFVFGDKTGYCVHFAHAAVYLMRTLGIPSRIGTGYAVDEAARQGGSALLLSGSASHAWPEVYVDQFGWVVLDVYPQSAADPPPPPMDSDLQRLLGELARGATPLPPESTDLPKIKALARDIAMRVMWWSVLFIGLLLAWMFAVKFWRLMAPRFATDSALSRVLYRAELDRLSEVSVRRRIGESREAFARRLSQTVPSFGPLTARHIHARFGDSAPDLSSMRRDAQETQEQLQQSVPRWRRWLGRMTPWSWLRTR